MTTVGISCPLGIESWQSTRTPRLDAFHSYKTRSANLRKCRPHGTWPGFWQLVSIHGCFRSPIQVPRSQPFPQLPWPYRRDWHSRCISMCRGNACNALGTSHQRMFSLAMVALLAAPLGFISAARAQDAPTDRVSRGRLNRSGITQQRRVTQWKRLDC